MRIGIFSDVHSNIEALSEVLAALRAEGVDQFVCLGDIIGYGAENHVTVVAEVPLNTMFGYSTDLRSATQGKAEFSMEFAKYAPVPRNEQEAMIKAYREKK